MNIALLLSYDGTAYHGWQVQKNGISVQETLTRAVNKLLSCKTYVSGVGRTDAGVHAHRYVASFKADCPVPLARLPYALRAFLPTDIVVIAACAVPDAFDARFDCVRKEYAYDLCTVSNPFAERYAYRFPYALSVPLMQEGARHFVGTQDFAAVRAMGTPVKSTVRTIYHCEVERLAPSPICEDSLVRIRVCGDGFLYNMVRVIAGTLAYVGSGRLAPDDVLAALASRERARAGPTLPPQGLAMHRLWYDETAELSAFALN